MVIISKLTLVNGTKIELGKPWPGEEDQTPVSLIIERASETEQDEDGSISEVPAAYECWLFSEELRNWMFAYFAAVSRRVKAGQPIPEEVKAALAKAWEEAPQDMGCRKVQMAQVESALEFRWREDVMREVFQPHLYAELDIELDEDEDEEEPAKPRANGPVAVAP